MEHRCPIGTKLVHVPKPDAEVVAELRKELGDIRTLYVEVRQKNVRMTRVHARDFIDSNEWEQRCQALRSTADWWEGECRTFGRRLRGLEAWLGFVDDMCRRVPEFVRLLRIGSRLAIGRFTAFRKQRIDVEAWAQEVSVCLRHFDRAVKAEKTEHAQEKAETEEDCQEIASSGAPGDGPQTG